MDYSIKYYTILIYYINGHYTMTSRCIIVCNMYTNFMYLLVINNLFVHLKIYK